MILVVGATGRLGRAVTEELLNRGHRVRAGCRTPSEASGLPDGADPVRVDLREPAGFPAALAGVNQVVTAVQGLTARRSDSIAQVDLEGHQKLIDAAVAAGVARFVYVSAQGADARHPAAFQRAKAMVENYLARSGLDYNILRPSAFIDLYAHEIIGKRVMAGKTVMLFDEGRTVRNLVAVDDVAAAIAAAVEGRLSDRVVDVVGASNADDREIAALYGRFADRPVKIAGMSPKIAAMIARLIGPFHAGVRNLLLFGAQNAQHGRLTADASHMVSIIGREPQGLESFVRQRVTAVQRT